MIVPIAMNWDFDGRGQRVDLVLTITPNLNIKTSKVFYIKFSPEFLSNLSIYQIYTYAGSDAYQLRNWIVSQRILAVTGWTHGLDGGRPFLLRITGIDSPGVDVDREIQLMVGDETGLENLQEWATAKSTGTYSPNSMELVFISDILYDENVIRINTNLSCI